MLLLTLLLLTALPLNQMADAFAVTTQQTKQDEVVYGATPPESMPEETRKNLPPEKPLLGARVSPKAFAFSPVTFTYHSRVRALANQSDLTRDRNWQFVAEGQLATIYAEKALYKKQGSERFFVHVRVQNKTRSEVGVDLGDYNKVVYPNQWGVFQEAQRGAINEGRILPTKLDETLGRSLLTSYRNHSLAMIKPGAAVDYFREFNASTIKQVESNNGKYLFISLDGQIFDTDGKTVETITLEWQRETKIDTEVWIGFPVQWKSIPDQGLVVGPNR